MTKELVIDEIRIDKAAGRGDSYSRMTSFEVGWLVVFYNPSTARSIRDGTPIYGPLRRM